MYIYEKPRAPRVRIKAGRFVELNWENLKDLEKTEEPTRMLQFIQLMNKYEKDTDTWERQEEAKKAPKKKTDAEKVEKVKEEVVKKTATKKKRKSNSSGVLSFGE